MSEQNLDKFLDTIRPYASDYASIDLRVIACQRKSGEWFYNSVTAILNDVHSKVSNRSDLPSVPGLIAAHKRWNIDRLQTILDAITSAKLIIDGQQIAVGRFDGQGFVPSTLVDLRFYQRELAKEEFGVDYASFAIKVWETTSGAIGYDDFERIDSALRSANSPWDGLQDLRERFMSIPAHSSGRTDGSTLEVIAPLRVRFKRSPTLGGKTVHLIAERSLRTTLSDICMSTIAHSGDQTIRKKYHFRAKNKTRPRATLAMSFELPDVPQRVALFLTYKNRVVDRGECFDSSRNPRVIAFERTGGSIEDLKRFLEHASGRPLESVVELLFHLLGFSAAPYGVLTSGVSDILAYPTSGNWLIVIECTGREPDLNNKITKLATRTKEIMEVLVGSRVIPMVATPLARTLVNKTDLEKAGKEGVAIITRDEIFQLAQMTKLGASVSQVREYILRHVPPNPDSGFGHLGWG